MCDAMRTSLFTNYNFLIFDVRSNEYKHGIARLFMLNVILSVSAELTQSVCHKPSYCKEQFFIMSDSETKIQAEVLKVLFPRFFLRYIPLQAAAILGALCHIVLFVCLFGSLFYYNDR